MNFSDVKQIGIIGGGASTLMLCIEAAKLGISTCLLDPKVNAIGAQVATEHIVAAITNENVKKLSLRCDKLIFNTKPDFEMDVKLHADIYPNKDTLNELCSQKNMLELLEMLEIPRPETYLQDNKEEAYSKLESLSLPFRFVKQYEHYSKQMDIHTKEDLADFILEMDPEADSFMIQPIVEYKQTISCICIVDQAGKVHLYDPIEVIYGEESICQLKIADTLSKNMITKLARYNRKILKELKSVGIYTIRYGIKANKSVELIDITPELGVGSILTIEAYGTSVFEQYIKLLLDMKMVSPVLEAYAHGTIKEIEQVDKEEVGHLYNIEPHALCVHREMIMQEGK